MPEPVNANINSVEQQAGSIAPANTVDAYAPAGALTGAQEPQEAMITPEELEQMRASEVAFSWQASEYVHHEKGPQWYAVLAGIMVVLIIAAIITQYWIGIALFLIIAAAIIVYARKPPRILTYELTQAGITIEGRSFKYGEFRSFSVLPDESWHSIDLEPVRRFVPRMVILFEDEDFEAIVGHLQLHLPMVDRQPDLIERFSRYVRF